MPEIDHLPTRPWVGVRALQVTVPSVTVTVAPPSGPSGPKTSPERLPGPGVKFTLRFTGAPAAATTNFCVAYPGLENVTR